MVSFLFQLFVLTCYLFTAYNCGYIAREYEKGESDLFDGWWEGTEYVFTGSMPAGIVIPQLALIDTLDELSERLWEGHDEDDHGSALLPTQSLKSMYRAKLLKELEIEEDAIDDAAIHSEHHAKLLRYLSEGLNIIRLEVLETNKLRRAIFAIDDQLDFNFDSLVHNLNKTAIEYRKLSLVKQKKMDKD